MPEPLPTAEFVKRCDVQGFEFETTDGEPDAHGEYPEDTLNGRIRQRLRWMAEQCRHCAAGDKENTQVTGGEGRGGRSNS